MPKKILKTKKEAAEHWNACVRKGRLLIGKNAQIKLDIAKLALDKQRSKGRII